MGSWHELTLQRVLVHVTAEAQRHAGHADIIRELIDGSAGMLKGHHGLRSDVHAERDRYRDKVEASARIASARDGRSALIEIHRVGDLTLGWGESLVWDERTDRLYFVDCAAQTLHWLEDGDGELHTFELPSMPTGSCPPRTAGSLPCSTTVCTSSTPTPARTALLAAYPAELGGRCNDACADLDGNLITGKLNLGPPRARPGGGRRPTAGGCSIPTSPTPTVPPSAPSTVRMTLIIGDTSADYLRLRLRARHRPVGPRRVFGDTSSSTASPTGPPSTPTAGSGARSSAAVSSPGSPPPASTAPSRCR